MGPIQRTPWRRLCLLTLGLILLPLAERAQARADDSPNVILIFADDMGYGDLGCFGHPNIRTPHLDGIAEKGIRLTSFYVPAPVCSPSRASLLTGRYPVRCGMPGNTGPGSDKHLPKSEITIAEALQDLGYRTMAVGKWHLGHQEPALLPTGRGFDHWFGLPYSNDMRKPWVQTDIPLRLYRDSEPVGDPGNQENLTERYTEEAVRFIREKDDRPFFLYLPHSMPHLPVRTSDRFKGQSDGGHYGDVIETIDWSTGEILQALKETGKAKNTLVLFTSDNGPWLDLPDRMLQEGNERWDAGSPGPLRGSKGTTYEGGVRVPFVASWPGRIPEGSRSNEVATTMDLFATIIGVAGGAVPADRTIDGEDILPVLTEGSETPHESVYFFRGAVLQAVRSGDWKLRKEGPNAETELFHVGRDPGERYNVADRYPERAAELLRNLNEFSEEVKKN